MGLLTSLLSLPLAPVRGVVWLGELIQEQVEQQMHDPADIRRELDELDDAMAAGRLPEPEYRQAQQQVLNRMIQRPEDPTPTGAKE
ncbi:gas vesicle protein GvpG [Nocardia flavorosea]|uniref:Gas vesicle protein G n=1 Tax=Nocardia flavorosea TaxID=53429 RepID=A0A846YHR9_9NOCA|nr:gas vesicle protein GvpG [Nocardia flavorosea]NKY57162.1 gas vesicle protein G [Nocardia flavorosea]